MGIQFLTELQALCVGAQVLEHWTTWEALSVSFIGGKFNSHPHSHLMQIHGF